MRRHLTSPRVQPPTAGQIENYLSRYRIKAAEKHGSNARGLFLYWGNLALRAFPSSPLQRAFQAEAVKFRNVEAKQP